MFAWSSLHRAWSALLVTLLTWEVHNVHAAAQSPAAPAAPQTLAVGQYRYALKQVNEQQVSLLSGDNGAITRELYFVMEVKVADESRLAVSLLLDSVIFEAGNTGRAVIAGYAGAGWKGVVERNGKRVRGGLVMQDGRETDSHYVVPLVWVIPQLTAGASDSIQVQIGAQRGPSRELTLTRQFSAPDGASMAFSGLLRTRILGDASIGGRAGEREVKRQHGRPVGDRRRGDSNRHNCDCAVTKNSRWPAPRSRAMSKRSSPSPA